MNDLLKPVTINGHITTLQEYSLEIDKVNSNLAGELESTTGWELRPDLTEKVDSNGSYKKFYGDTVLTFLPPG
jgi:hypothetical protein